MAKEYPRPPKVKLGLALRRVQWAPGRKEELSRGFLKEPQSSAEQEKRSCSGCGTHTFNLSVLVSQTKAGGAP